MCVYPYGGRCAFFTNVLICMDKRTHNCERSSASDANTTRNSVFRTAVKH